LFSELLAWNAEQVGEFGDVFWRGLGLAVEEGCNGYFGAPEFVGNGFEVEAFDGFGVKEGFGGGGEAVDEGGLGFVFVSILLV